MSLDIVIPVYNEGNNIRSTLSEIRENIKSHHNIHFIYDFEEDSTIPIVREFAKKVDNIFLIKNKYGKGVLNAIKTGFESVEGDTVLVSMADLSDDLSIVDKMVEKINEGFDIVCGSRYMNGGRQIGGPRIKKILSKIAGMSLHYFIGIPTRDVTNSFKMYSRKVLESIAIKSNGGFELGMEIVIKSYLKGYKIAEIPTTWRDRVSGKSNFKLLQWLPHYIHWYVWAISKKLFKKTNL